MSSKKDELIVNGVGEQVSNTSEIAGQPPRLDTLTDIEPEYPDKAHLLKLVGHGVRLMEYSELYTEVDGKKKFLRSNWVGWMKRVLKFYTIGGRLFYYKDGSVHSFGDRFIRQITENAFSNIPNHEKNEMIHHIRDSSIIDESELVINPYILPVKNGLLNIDTEELSKFDSNIFSWNKIPVTFNPDATCPEIEQFLIEVLPEQKDRTLFLEWCGFCLFRQHHFKRFFMALGKQNTGKSVTLGILEKLIGEKNIVSTNLMSLESNRFATAKLHRKMLNIQADISGAAIKRSPILKSLTGNDLVPAEYKGGDLFEFRNYSKLTFSCNMPPEFLEESNAVFSRLLFIEFNQEFKEGENAKPNLIESLTTNSELSGFLNLCLKHLRQILENKRFSFDLTPEEVRKYYERKSNNLAWFLEECCDFVADSRVSKEQFFNEYSKFCFDNKTAPLPLAKVGRELPRLMPVTSGRLGGQRTTCWVNIKLKQKDETKDENKDVPFEKDAEGNLVLKEEI